MVRREVYLTVTEVKDVGTNQVRFTMNNEVSIYCPTHQAPRVGQSVRLTFAWENPNP